MFDIGVNQYRPCSKTWFVLKTYRDSHACKMHKYDDLRFIMPSQYQPRMRTWCAFNSKGWYNPTNLYSYRPRGMYRIHVWRPVFDIGKETPTKSEDIVDLALYDLEYNARVMNRTSPKHSNYRLPRYSWKLLSSRPDVNPS